MTTTRPSKPWRVILSGPAGFVSETDHTSETKAYAHLRYELAESEASPATTANVMQWADGRWGHFETVHSADLLVDKREQPKPAPPFGVVFDRPAPGRVYAWGPFADWEAAARFAEFVQAEIDPARVIPWQDALALPGVRVLDPVAELLTWRTSVALPMPAQLADRLEASNPDRGFEFSEGVDWAVAELRALGTGQ